MKYNISKELFDAVRKDVNGVISIDCSKQEIDNYFRVNYKNNYGLFNYNDFFFKCKEWLKTTVSNSYSGFDNGHRYFTHIERANLEDRFYAETEQQAVFDACQYILETKE